MATNKNAFLRYKILDSCFRNIGKKYFIDDLIATCNKVLWEKLPNFNGISRRQIFDDIEFMESGQGWAIDLKRHKEGRKVYYRYSDTKFSINNMPLNEVEIKHLESAIDIISQFSGMPQFTWVSEVISKLNNGIIKDKTTSPIMSFDSNPYLKGIDHLGIIYNAIHYKKVLSIIYRPYGQDPYTINLHPYFLKQYNNRWFLLGLNKHVKRPDWNIALDRVQQIKETNEQYIENSSINWDEYFEDIIGVTRPNEFVLDKIVLHFFGNTGFYIESKPIHGSQKANWIENDILEVKLEVVINYELEKELLSFGEQLKIISPMHLAEKIKQRLKAGLKNY